MGLGGMSAQCMLKKADTVLYSNIHFFFVDEPLQIKCQPLTNQTTTRYNLYVNTGFTNRDAENSQSKSENPSMKYTLKY